MNRRAFIKIILAVPLAGKLKYGLWENELLSKPFWSGLDIMQMSEHQQKFITDNHDIFVPVINMDGVRNILYRC